MAGAAAATARAISQLVVTELHNGYGVAEAAADEAEAAAAVAELSASMPVLPRLPGTRSAAEQRLLVAPRGETDEEQRSPRLLLRQERTTSSPQKICCA